LTWTIYMYVATWCITITTHTDVLIQMCSVTNYIYSNCYVHRFYASPPNIKYSWTAHKVSEKKETLHKVPATQETLRFESFVLLELWHWFFFLWHTATCKSTDHSHIVSYTRELIGSNTCSHSYAWCNCVGAAAWIECFANTN